MRKILLAVGLAGAMASSSVFAAFDGTVVINSGSPYQYGNGGEFQAVSSGLGTFITFCIEHPENLGFGGRYDYTINTGAVRGGGGANATDPHTGLAMDNISIGTAYLYSQFRSGALAGYFTGNRYQHAGELQNAIWYLEGEITSLAYNGADGTAFYNLAMANAGAGSLSVTEVAADSGGAYGVVALNLFNGPYSQSFDGYNLNQDVLAIVPEPTTMIAGALLLLPFGASAMRIVRKGRAA